MTNEYCTAYGPQKMVKVCRQILTRSLVHITICYKCIYSRKIGQKRSSHLNVFDSVVHQVRQVDGRSIRQARTIVYYYNGQYDKLFVIKLLLTLRNKTGINIF